jgi:hypothetical protein
VNQIKLKVNSSKRQLLKTSRVAAQTSAVRDKCLQAPSNTHAGALAVDEGERADEGELCKETAEVPRD